MVCVFTRRCGGGRRPPEVLVVRGAAAQTAGAAQRGLGEEVSHVGQPQVRGEAVALRRHFGVPGELIRLCEDQHRRVRHGNKAIMFLFIISIIFESAAQLQCPTVFGCCWGFN